MDCFYRGYLDRMITLSKKKIVNKLSKLELTENEVCLYSDMLTQVLEFSPNILYSNNNEDSYKVYLLDQNQKDEEISMINDEKNSIKRSRRFSLNEEATSQKSSTKMSHTFSSEINKFLSSKNLAKVFVENIIEDIIDSVVNKRKVSSSKSKQNLHLKRNSIIQLYADSLNKIKISENMLRLHIFIKVDRDLISFIQYELPKKDKMLSLLDILKRLIEENKLHPKIISIYYFTKHNLKSNINHLKEQNNIEHFLQDEDQKDDEIDLNSKIVDIFNSNDQIELDLHLKNFPDMPDFKCLSFYTQFIDSDEKSEESM